MEPKKLFKKNYQNSLEAQALTEVSYSNNRRSRISHDDEKSDDWSKFEIETRELLMNLGAVVVNNKEFKFDLSSYNLPTKKSRQIDAIGYLEHAGKKFLLIAECKHSSKGGKRSNALKGAYDEISKNINPVKKRIKEIFVDGKEITPIWILSSCGHQTSATLQKQFLQQGEIICLAEEEQTYFNECYELSRSPYFVFNQFLGTFKSRTRLYKYGPNKDDLKLGALKIITDYNKKKEAFTFTAKVGELMPLCMVSHRRQKKIFSDDTKIKDRKGNYQRIITKKRIASVAAHLNTNKKPFTNNILVSYRGKKNNLVFKEHLKIGQKRTGELQIKGHPGSFHVIDGQHRLFGYSKITDQKILDHEIIVTAFKDLDQSEEARIFLDVNNGQTKVDISLRREVQMILGSSASGKEQVDNLITSLIINLREDDDSPFNKPVCIPLPEGRNDLPFKRLSDAFNFGQLMSADKDFKKGYLNKNNDYDQTLSHATKFIKNYFDQIKNSIPKYWKKPSRKDNVVALKTAFIGGCIYLLERMITEKTKGRVVKHSKLAAEIQPMVDHLCQQLIQMNDDQRMLIFGWRKNGAALTEGANKYPLARYYLIKELMEDKYPELLFENDLKEEVTINESQGNSEPYEETLKKIHEDTEEAQIAQNYEVIFWQNLHNFLTALFGADYWQNFISSEFTKEVFTPSTDKKKAKQRSKFINLATEKQDVLYANDLYWCDWTEIKELLTGIYNNKNQEIDIYVDIDESPINLKTLIDETFFIQMPDQTNIPQSPKQGLLWIEFISELSNLVSHPREGVKASDTQISIFRQIESNLYSVLDKMQEFSKDFLSDEDDISE